MSYPDGWPGCCPPPDVVSANGALFRVVKANPPTADDFRSQAELGRMPDADPCLRVGVSMMKTVEDALHHRKLFRKAGKHIARMNLSPAYGVTKDTPTGNFPSHATWWSPEGIARESAFNCMVEDE